jgi:hypothetical protein
MMLEQVRPKLSYFLAQKQSKLMNLINKAAEKHNVSAFTDSPGSVRAWRVPVLLNMGGDYQAVSLDGGDLGSGSFMNTAAMFFGTFENDLAYNIPLRAIQGTKDPKQAVTNALQFSIGQALKEMALYNEIGFFQDSTGQLATAASTTSSPGTTAVYVLETAAFSYIRLRGYNTLVDIYDTGGVLRATGGRISVINFATNTVTITGLSSFTPAAGDLICFPMMGTSVGSSTTAAGSWRNGLYTFNSTSTSGSLGGLAYSSAYELATPTVNAGTGYYTPAIQYAGKAQLIQRRDEEAYSGVVGVCHPAQQASYLLQGLTISNWFRGPSDKMIDLAPKSFNYSDTFQAADVPHYVSRYAEKDRVDWINPSNFGWTQLADIDFVQTPEGQRIFIGHNATTGNPAAGFQFYILNTRNLYSVDPGCGVVFYGLKIPSGL